MWGVWCVHWGLGGGGCHPVLPLLPLAHLSSCLGERVGILRERRGGVQATGEAEGMGREMWQETALHTST